MADDRWLTVLLALQGVLLLGARAQTEVKLVGSEVTMVPIYTGDPSEINWKINGNKLVDMEVTPPNDPIFYKLKERATIDRTNGRLTIRNLTIGDSGLYRAEVLVENNVYQYTDIKLTVRDCPVIPTISDRSTDDQIVLQCDSSTPGVTYEWFYQTGSVGKNQLYSERRSKKDVTLTCVVDNEVCKKNTSITIRYTPESSGLSGGIIALLIVIFFLVLIPFLIVMIIAMCYEFREGCMKPIYTFITDKKESSEEVFRQVHSWFPCFKENNEKNVVNPEEVHLNPNPEEPDSYGCISLNPSSVGPVQSVKLVKVGAPSIEAQVGELNGQPQRIKSLSLTVEREKAEDYTAEALLSNGKSCVFTIKGVKCDEEEDGDNDVQKGNGAADTLDGKVEGVKGYKDDDVEKGNGAADTMDGTVEETENNVIIATDGARVTLMVPDTEKVTKLTWQKGGVPQFEWTISGVKLQTNKITLEPGSVTIKNLVPGDSGPYEVEVHSTDDRITKNTFQLEVVKQVKTKNPRNVVMKVVRTVDPPEKGHPESQPIRSITFHPIKMSNKTEITWKKGDQPVTIDGDRMKRGQNGDLTINHVEPGDQGKYTVQCEDQELEQEFTLRL